MQIMNYTHPQWCDPRLCECTERNLDHRGAPTSWKPIEADAHLSVGLVRLDEIGYFDNPGTTNVLFAVDEEFTDGGPVELDLSPNDARMLAAALVMHADRAEQRWAR